MMDRAFDLPSEASSAARARSFVREFVHEFELGRTAADDGELLVSELVTNAIRHGAPTIRLSLGTENGDLTVRVHDSGARLPVIRSTSIDRPGGRGLQMVERLASAWGVDREAQGKTVWFRIDGTPR